MRNKGVILTIIIILIIIVIFLITLLIGLLNKNVHFNFLNINQKVSNELIFNESYENIFTNIKIDSDSSEVYIKESNDEKIRVIIYGDNDRTEIKDSTDTLSIKTTAQKCIGICLNNEMSSIEIYLPKNYNKDINIQNHYGDIEIEKLIYSRIYIDADCGDIKIEEASYLDIVNSYGDIQIDKADKSKIKAACGNVKIREIADAIIENNYGDIKIESITNSMNINDDCGDIKIDRIDLKVDSKVKNNLGNIKIGETNNIYIDASTDLGEVKINKNDRNALITLQIENDCGDIKVNN